MKRRNKIISITFSRKKVLTIKNTKTNETIAFALQKIGKRKKLVVHHSRLNETSCGAADRLWKEIRRYMDTLKGEDLTVLQKLLYAFRIIKSVKTGKSFVTLCHRFQKAVAPEIIELD